MEEGGLVSLIVSYFISRGPVYMRHLPGELLAPGCTIGRKQHQGDSVMLWAMLCYVDATLTHITYITTATDPYTLSWKP